jgi:hypothetical protein
VRLGPVGLGSARHDAVGHGLVRQFKDIGVMVNVGSIPTHR